MSWAPLWAVTFRHLCTFRRDLNALLSGFYWPVLDVLTWGFLGAWIQEATRFHNYGSVALLGLLLWQLVGRGGNFISYALGEELWVNNVINLFSLPLRTIEWIAGVIVFYGIMVTVTSLICLFFIFVLYDVSLWSLLTTFLIFVPPLLFSGIWIGFTCLQITITLGRRGTELGNVIVWFLTPFSGAFYPIEVLPRWGQTLSSFLPMSYVFRGMREYVMHQQDPTPYLINGYMLSIIYALCSVLLFIYCFNRSKNKGLARLTD